MNTNLRITTAIDLLRSDQESMLVSRDNSILIYHSNGYGFIVSLNRPHESFFLPLGGWKKVKVPETFGRSSTKIGQELWL
jgi:hypothetical protein